MQALIRYLENPRKPLPANLIQVINFTFGCRLIPGERFMVTLSMSNQTIWGQCAKLFGEFLRGISKTET
jgi:hypothetical protein